MFYIFNKILTKLNLQKHKLKDFKKHGKHITLPTNGTIRNKHKIQLDDYVYIGSDPYIFAEGGIRIGTNVIIGPRVTILTSSHNYENPDLLPYDYITNLKEVTIEQNVWIGANVQICPGVTIGEGAVIAMGSVVTSSVAPCDIVGGNPARTIKKRNFESYKRLKENNMLYLKLKAENKINTLYEDKSNK